MPTRRQQKKSPIMKRTSIKVASLVTFIIVALLIAVSSNASRQSVASAVSQNGSTIEPVLGHQDAPVTIIEYGAYGCTACRAWHNAHIIEQILGTYPDKVRFIFRDFPVIVPTYDHMAAEVAHCALDQGQDVFWKFHDALYTIATPQSSQDDLFDLGAQVGLDRSQLQSCTRAGTYRSIVENNLNRALNLGLRGTPGFLVNDIVVYNASPEILQAAVEKALRS